MNWFKAVMDLVVHALNYFPGYKTKAGAVLQLIGTILIFYNTYVAPAVGMIVPVDIVIAINAAAATLVAVGAANQPVNNKPNP